MERLEDKIIRNKIDSIADLPSGYQPSIQGKWELMENAMPQRKNRKKIVFAIAASVLLLIGFSGLFFRNVIVQKPGIVLQNQLKENVNQRQSSQKLAEKNVVAKAVKTNVAVIKNGFKLLKNIAPNNNEIVKQERKDSVFEEKNVEDVLQGNTIAAISPSAKKSKKLYVEIDFNDAPQVQTKTENKVAENKVKFKVSIFKNKSKTTEEIQPSTVLKISKEFPLNN